MEILLFIVVAIVLFVVIRIYYNATATLDDPKPMSNHHLLASIAGQADWLEKMSRAPIESQNSPSIIALARKRRNYIAQLCLEFLSRDHTGGYEPIFPGTSSVPHPFSEVAQYAKDLEQSGVNKDNAAVRAVKEKLFHENGISYLARWEI